MLAENLEDLTYEDVLDSRDLEEMIEELEEHQAEELEDDYEGDAFDEDKVTLLVALRKLRAATEGEGWHDGIQFIRESHFTDYAKELAEDLGAVPDEYTWPTSCIDWEQAARELQMDYSAITIDKVDFWYREA